MLEEGQAISKIAKEVNITRQTVYRIKHDKELFTSLAILLIACPSSNISTTR